MLVISEIREDRRWEKREDGRDKRYQWGKPKRASFLLLKRVKEREDPWKLSELSNIQLSRWIFHLLRRETVQDKLI